MDPIATTADVVAALKNLQGLIESIKRRPHRGDPKAGLGDLVSDHDQLLDRLVEATSLSAEFGSDVTSALHRLIAQVEQLTEQQRQLQARVEQLEAAGQA